MRITSINIVIYYNAKKAVDLVMKSTALII